MFNMIRQATIKLDDNDAAIVLKADGTMKASLPDIVEETVPENVFMGAALIYALNNEEMCQKIYDNFIKECGDTFPKMAAND